MKLKLTLSALLIAGVPMAAQAGQAPALTMQLNEPLAYSGQATSPSAETHAPLTASSAAIENQGASAAMAKARARLEAQHRHVTDIELTVDPLTPAREATT
ncbi:hypothetical protein RAN53_11195 [Halomonas sp. SSL-5]|uniref:hypothetical protein n=1 Tax=Halomonas sp. SSL-5 TaxID=3065855 RepID=UPI002738D0C2|nr:hypothetical protein [Halomonas sp. SSL-5]MDY7116916.1 hypothetical protein [Halomonas sp. SSL-5]